MDDHDLFRSQVEDRGLCDMDLDSFVNEALRFVLDDSDRHQRLFVFIRLLLSHRVFNELPADAAWTILDDVINRTSEDEDGFWGEFVWDEMELTADDAAFLFPKWWEIINVPFNVDPLSVAVERAKGNATLSRFVKSMPGGKPGGRFAQLLDISYQLQLQITNTPVALPQERLAEYLGSTQQHVSKLLNRANDFGLVQLVTKGNNITGKSSTYLVWTDLSCCPRPLQEKLEVSVINNGQPTAPTSSPRNQVIDVL